MSVEVVVPHKLITSMAGEKRRRRERVPRGHRNGKAKQDTSDEDYVLDDEEESTCEDDEEEDSDADEEEDSDEEWTEPRKRLRKNSKYEDEEDSDWIESRKRLGKDRLVSGSEDLAEEDDTDEDEEDELDTDEDDGEWIAPRKRSRARSRAPRGDSRLSRRWRTRKSGRDTGSSSSSKQKKKGVTQRRKSARKRHGALRVRASSSRLGNERNGCTQRRKNRKKHSNGGRERFVEIGSPSYENKDVDLRRESKGKEPVVDENVGYDDKLSEGNVDQLCGICLTEVGKAERGTLDSCDHYFCYICIMEWAKVESRCPMCKQRFMKIVRPANLATGRNRTIRIPLRNQVYVPSDDELREYEDPYANVVCMECHEADEERLLLLCDLCDAAAHTYCVGLGRSVPRGDWFCRCCQVLAPESSLDQDEDLTLVFDTNHDDSTARETPMPVAQHEQIASARSTTLSATVRNPRRRLRRRLVRQPTHHTNNSPVRPFETVSTSGDQTAEAAGIGNPHASAQQTDTARTVPNQRLLQEMIQNIHERWEESQMGTEELPSMKDTVAISCSPSLARAFSHEIAETSTPSRSHEIIERSRTLGRWEESQMGTEELPSTKGTTAISCSPSLARAFSHEIGETSPRSHEIIERSRTLGDKTNRNQTETELPRSIISTLPMRQVTSCKEEPDVAHAWTMLVRAKAFDGTSNSIVNLGKNEVFSHLFNRQRTYGAKQYTFTTEALTTTAFQNRASLDEPYKSVLKRGDLEENPERGHDIWHSRRAISNSREEYLEGSSSANSAAGKAPVNLFDKRNESSIQASDNCGFIVLSSSSGVDNYVKASYGRESLEKSDGNALAKCSWRQFSDGERLDVFQCGLDKGHSILPCGFPFSADTFEAHKASFQKKYRSSAQEADNLEREGCTCMHGSVNPCVHSDKTVIMQGAGVSSHQEKQRIVSQVAVRATCENASDHLSVNEKTRQGKSMKAHMLRLVKAELWPIYLSEGLSKEQFKEVARSATHALLAMFDLEHHKNEFELETLHCCHGNSLGQSLIGDFCESCLKTQVQVVVQTISRRISRFGA